MAIETRHLAPGDEALFVSIAEDVFDAPVSSARLTAYLAEAGHHMIVALDGDLIVGQVAAVVHRHPDKPTELYLDELGVAPSHQRQGIGRRLLEEMLALGRRLGCEEVWVGTEHDNVPARALYRQRLGEAEEFVLYVGTL